MDADIVDDRAQSRLELTVDGRIAFLAYERTRETFSIVHTEVPPEARGHGVSDALIRAALAFARERSLNVMATCPFAQRWLAAHPDERPRPGPSS